MINAPDNVELNEFYIEDLRQMANAHNYRDWQFEMVLPYVRGATLEVGGGIGNFTSRIAQESTSVVSIEPNEYCYEALAAAVHGLKNVRIYQTTVEMLPSVLETGSRFSSIVLMNVLEHVEDHVGVIASLKELTTEDGRVVILVPACNWAFGKTDAKLGHFRRYSKASARALAQSTGLYIERLKYFNFLGLWAWWFNAKVLRREAQSDSQIQVFDKLIVPIVSFLEKFMPIPIGQSLLIVLRNNKVRPAK